MNMPAETTSALGPDSSAATSGGQLAVGSVVAGRFAVEAFLGVGALGERYQATDRNSGGPVLLKLLSPELVADGARRGLLEQDVSIATQLDHKNIAVHQGLSTEGERLFLVGELVDGMTLRQMLDRKREAGNAFSLKGAYNLVTHLCNALEYAHGVLVHGLVSPDTVLVNGAGRVKLADFGLGRALAGVERVAERLSPEAQACRAPELLRPMTPFNRRADVYAVGVLLFELLAGRPPRELEPLSLAAQGVPSALDAVVQRCLQPAPNARFAQIAELRQAVHAACAKPLGLTPAAAPPPPPPSATPGRGTPPPPPGQAASRTPPQALPARRPTPLQMQVAATERWLIQKDKLDFGPFTLADVKAQIEAGQVRASHLVIDMETGERMPVREHPLLRELAIVAEHRLEAGRQLENIAAEERAHRKRLMMLLASGIAAVVLAVGGGVLWIVKHPSQPQERIVYRDRGGDTIKLELSTKVDEPAAKAGTKRAHHRKAGGTGGTYDDSINLGDATEGGGDETLSQEQVQQVMSAHISLLSGCLLEERRRNPDTKGVSFDFIIKGSGQVAGVKANGSTETPLAACIYGKLQSVQFPKFNGAKTHASFSLAFK